MSVNWKQDTIKLQCCKCEQYRGQFTVFNPLNDFISQSSFSISISLVKGAADDTNSHVKQAISQTKLWDLGLTDSNFKNKLEIFNNSSAKA